MIHGQKNIKLHAYAGGPFIIIIVFPLLQWTHQRTSMLRYKYIACLVFPSFSITSVLIYTLSLKESFM